MLRKRGGDLPTTFNASSQQFPDGSGKSIKMEAPLVKAMRSADGFTKGTYVWLFVSILFIWSGWSWIRSSSSSIVLDCHAGGCTITIHRPYKFVPRNSRNGVPIKSKRKRKTVIKIDRDQLVRADNVKWDPESQVIVENYGVNSPTYNTNQQGKDEEEDVVELGNRKPSHKKKKYKKYNKKANTASYRTGGPDSNGNYDSYTVVLRDPLPPNEEGEIDPNESPSMRMARQMAAQHNTMEHDPNSLASLLAPFAVTDGSGSTEYVIHPRDFNIGQTRRLARTTVSKINAYTKGRRASFIIRESRPVAWQGLVLLIFGIFSLVLCLLLGQFWDEYDPTKVGSYRQRMAEIRKREEAKKLRQRKTVGRKPAAVRRPPAEAPAAGRVARSVSRTSTSSTGGVARMRPNAGANQSQGDNSWTGSMGGVADAYTKRGY